MCGASAAAERLAKTAGAPFSPEGFFERLTSTKSKKSSALSSLATASAERSNSAGSKAGQAIPGILTSSPSFPTASEKWCLVHCSDLETNSELREISLNDMPVI